MAIIFKKLPIRSSPPIQAINTAYLQPSIWDDFSHKTLFNLIVFDEQGNNHQIGNVKIGFIGQNEGWTNETLPQQFETLPGDFYSLGQDADYYKNLVDKFSDEIVISLLTALGDVIYDSDRLAIAENDRAFNISLMRNVNRATIEDQFRRILRREALLTNYDFVYEKAANAHYSGIKIEFQVEPNSKPSSNIHILIGRNGVGKTTLLNDMVDALLPSRGMVANIGRFSTRSAWGDTTELQDGYFAGVVSVSFSAFDPFIPPDDPSNTNAGMRYNYIGLKKSLHQQTQDEESLKNKYDLCRDFTDSLDLCFALTAKKDRWVNAVRKLESDFNFAEMDLCHLAKMYTTDLSDTKKYFHEKAMTLFNRMSSGHAIVLLTVTKLVETVEEKTLVLLDEPESHLHPPLLSAFTRALSDLLVNRNGVAIIATHSPVVLQEVPKACVSILRRTRLILNVDRPESETFAENVGALTREIFGLEVSKSGFHELLLTAVHQGKSYDDIIYEYGGSLGFEGRSLLRAFIANSER